MKNIIFGMKKMELSKTSKNDGLPQDFFRRAKRAGKIAVLGLAEKKTLQTYMNDSILLLTLDN